MIDAIKEARAFLERAHEARDPALQVATAHAWATLALAEVEAEKLRRKDARDERRSIRPYEYGCGRCGAKVAPGQSHPPHACDEARSRK